MTIQFSDMQVTYKQFLDDVSKAVCKKLKKDLKQHDKWLTTNEAAEVLGITPDYLRHQKDKYGGVKRGSGKQSRLVFSQKSIEDWMHNVKLYE